MSTKLKEIMELLDNNPELAQKIYEKLKYKLVTTVTINNILEEMRMKGEKDYILVKQHFEEMEKRFNGTTEQLQTINSKLDDHDEEFVKVHTKLEEHNHRFDKVEGKLEEHDQRFDKVEGKLEEHDQRFDTVDQRFDTVDQRFNSVDLRFNKVDKRLNDIQAGLGINFEGYNKNVLMNFLEAQGVPARKMIWRAKINDPERKIHDKSTEVEIDLFLEDPLIIVEVTSIEQSITKVRTFIKIIKWLERKYKRNAKAYYLLFDFEEEIREESINLLETNNVTLISTQT